MKEDDEIRIVGFHPDTEVLTVDGRKKITEIKDSIRVYSLVGYEIHHIFIGPAIKSAENAETLKITMSNGDHLIVGPDTKLCTELEGWIEASEVQAKDKIVMFLGDEVVLRSVRSVKKGETTDLYTVEGGGCLIDFYGFCARV